MRSAGGVKALIHYKQPLGALMGSELHAAKRPLRYASGMNPALLAFYDLVIRHVYTQYIPLDNSFQTVKIKKLETHTIQNNLQFIYQAGYEIKTAKFSSKIKLIKT